MDDELSKIPTSNGKPTQDDLNIIKNIFEKDNNKFDFKKIIISTLALLMLFSDNIIIRTLLFICISVISFWV